MTVTKEQVLDALREVQDPELFRDIVSLGMVKEVRLDPDAVYVNVELTTPACPLKDVIEKDVKAALTRIGVHQVQLELSANTRGAAGGKKNSDLLPQVKNVIAIGAGKGGVGKSTVALHVAVGLARHGAKVGLMDGDIYGPSMPTMLGIRGIPPQVRGNKLVPLFVHGIHAITIGSLVESDKPLIWRGPMAHGAFKQLLADQTEWPELDYLLVDLPPGTGDVPLTLCQLLPLVGAVIVATPQQVALDDCIRAAKMFQHLETPILGVVENMSYFVSPDGSAIDVFGRGGAEKAAGQLELPFLGALPMFPELRINCDAGDPTASFTRNPLLTEALNKIVQNLAAQVSLRNLSAAAPEVTIS